MFELILILCLGGEPDKCSRFDAVTDSCPVAMQHIMAAAPEDAAVKFISCRRVKNEPPTVVAPKKETTA